MGGGVAGAGQMLQVRYRTGGREEPLDGAVTEEGVGGELEDGGAGWKNGISKKCSHAGKFIKRVGDL